MNRILRAALAALALALVSSSALAQSAFPTTGGSYVDGKALMCVSGGVATPCASSGGTLTVGGTFSASFSGFTPTPAYSQLAVGATSSRVALPTGTVVIVYNTGSNAASVTLGSAAVVATGANDIIQPGSWMAFTVGSFVDIAGIEATGAGGTTTLVVSGGAGLPTGAGGGGSGGGGSFPSVYAAPGATSPANTLMVGAQQGTSPGVIQNLIVDATQALKVGFSGAAQPFNLTQLATTNLGAPTTWGTAPTGLTVLGVNADVLASALPTGAATAANQEVTAAGTTATSAQGIQGVTGGVPVPISGSVSATFSQFAPNGNYSTPLTVGATSSRVALPSGGGATVGVYNVGANPAFVRLGNSSVAATGVEDQIAPGGFMCFAVGANVDIAAIETAGATTLNISGGSGGCAGSGGGGGGASGVVQQGLGNASNPWTVAPSSGSVWPASQNGNWSVFSANTNGTFGGIIQAGASVPINISTATTTQLVALSSGLSIYVTSWDVIAAGTGNITLEYGTGSNCGTGTTALTGAYNLTAQNGIAKGAGLGAVLIVPAGNALCALTSAAVQMSGSLSYSQF